MLAHNRDEETEHAAMSLEWLRRQDAVLDDHLRTYLFTSGSIVGLEEEAEGGGGEGGGGPATAASASAACAGRPDVNHLHPRARAHQRGGLAADRRRGPPRAAPLPAARKLVDFTGPLGWDHSALASAASPTGDGPAEGVERRIRLVQPFVELRTPFSLDRVEIDAVDRGAPDADWDPVVDAARRAALAEDRLVFGGTRRRASAGIIQTSTHDPVTITPDYDQYPTFVAKAVDTLRRAGMDGPYAIAARPPLLTGRDRDDRARRLPAARAPAPHLEGPVSGRPRSTARWC